MQPFTFDVIAPSPVSGASFGPPAGPRPSARFEDHLGIATLPPRESSPDRAPLARDAGLSSNPASETSESNAAAIDDDREPDSTRKPENELEDRDGGDVSAEDSAAVAAGGNAMPQDASVKRADDESRQPNAENGDGKSAKPKGRIGQAKAVKGDDPAALQPAGNVDETNRATEALPADASVEKSAAIESRTTDDKVNPGQGAIAVLAGEVNTDGVAVAATAASAAAPDRKAVSAATDDATDDSTAAVQKADSTVRSEEITGGRRTRGAKAGEAIAPNAAQQLAGKTTSEASQIAPTAAATIAHTELAAAVETASNQDAATADASPSQSKDQSDLRPGPPPSVLAARQDKAHETTGRGEGLTEAQRVQFVQRVARAFHSLGDEGGEVRLRLSPPELGSLRLELTVRDGAMSARLETETAAARNVLLENLPALRERLADQNIKVERFDVDVRDEQRQSSGEQFADQAGLPRQGQRQRQRAYETRAATAAAERATRGTIKHDASELNIVI